MDLCATLRELQMLRWVFEQLEMASALHPQTILALDFDGQPLTPEWGAPVRLRIPTKLGSKSAKNLQAIE
jgi:DMSO/TMAO reductase YedYZ molybdopterin-dependent catalytic subunit